LLKVISGTLDEQLVEAAVERAIERLRTREAQLRDRRNDVPQEPVAGRWATTEFSWSSSRQNFSPDARGDWRSLAYP